MRKKFSFLLKLEYIILKMLVLIKKKGKRE